MFLLLIFVAGRCLVPMDETDLFFNLRLGELWLGTGKVATENTLSFTHPHASEVNLAWLFQGLLVQAYRWGNIPGTVLLKTGFVLLTWTLLYRVARRWGAHPVWAALALALAAWSAEPRFVERPHLVTFLGLATLFLALARLEAGKPWLLWTMLPLGLVWVNANSCFFLAPSILLVYTVGAVIDNRRAEARHALLVALGLMPLIFATPSGFGALTYIANHWRMPDLRPLEEYRRVAWPVDGAYFFLTIGLLFFFGWDRCRRHFKPKQQFNDETLRIPIRYLLPCAALAILGALRIRFVAEYSMLAGPLLALGLTYMISLKRWSIVPAIVILLVLTISPRLMALHGGEKVIDIGMEPDLVPHQAIAFTTQHKLRKHMYCDMEVGSYLTFEGWPEYPVFQDPRINSYPEAFHAVLRRSDLTRSEWQAFLDGYGVRSALVTYPDVNPRGAWFDPMLWALVYRARDGLVFVRRSHKNDLAEIPLTFTFARETGLLPQPLIHKPASSNTSACDWAYALGEFFQWQGKDAEGLAAYERGLTSAAEGDATRLCRHKTQLALGSLALRLGQAARAAEVLNGLTELEAVLNHGFAMLSLGKLQHALADFDQVLAKSFRNDEALFGRGLTLAALGKNEAAIEILKLLLARSPNHVSAPMARAALLRLTTEAQ